MSHSLRTAWRARRFPSPPPHPRTPHLVPPASPLPLPPSGQRFIVPQFRWLGSTCCSTNLARRSPAVHTHAHARASARTHIFAHARTRKHTHRDMCARAHTHTHTQPRVHTHTHARTRTHYTLTYTL